MISGKSISVIDWLSRNGDPDKLLWISIPIILGAGLLLGVLSSFMLVVYAACAIILGFLFAWRQYALLAVIIVGVGVFIDFYLWAPLPFYVPDLATISALLFLAAAFFAQSSARPWIRVPYLGWWLCVLVLAFPQAIRGGLVINGGKYYVEVYVDALLLYMIGVQVARDLSSIRRLFALLSGLAAVIAIDSILEGITRHILLPTHYWDSYLASVHNFALSGSKEIRAGSFFINPDSDGTFLAVMLLLPVTLLLETRSRLLKGLYAVEAVLIALGLFFTYSLIAIGAVCLGGVLFIMLVGKGRYRFYLLGLIGALILVILLVFHSFASLLLSRSNAFSSEVDLRLGAWETGVRVILAHPLFGLGFGFHAYLDGAEPYRVALQHIPLIHPHDSFLEYAALAGIPMMVLMLVIFGKLFVRAFRNYRSGESAQRILLGGSIAALVTMTINSLANNSWNLPPFVLMGWLLFGVTCSPALLKSLRLRGSIEKYLPEEEQQANEVPLLPEGVQS